MARTRRIRKVSVPDLRLALGFMCFTSFVLTFLYVDTADLSDNSNNLLPYDESQFETQEAKRTADDLLSSLDAGNTRVDTTIQEEGEGDESLLLQEDDEGIAEPEVLTIQPFHGPATGGMLVSIHGHNLKGSRGYGEPTAYVGGQPCSVTTLVEQEEITCITPAGVGSRLSVRVVLHRQDGDVEFGPNGQELPPVLGSKDNTLFSYDDPSVDSVTPDHGQTSGGTRLTIEGANFGQPEAAGGVEAIVGGTPCIETEHVSDKQVVCVSPPGTAGARSVVVTVGSGEHKTESKRNYLFAYIMTPEERLNLEAGSLLDGLLVRYDRQQMHLVMHRMSVATTAKGVLTSSPHEYMHRDLFSGRTSVYNIPPELMSAIPEEDFKPQYPTCAVVGNSGILLDADYGEAIDGAHAVFRFNNAPTTNYERHVGSKTTFRMAETRFVRALLARDPQQRKSGWRPTNKQTLLVWSEYAQDLYVQMTRVFARMSIYYLSRGLVGNVRTLYTELRRRFEDLGVSSSFKLDNEELATKALESAGVVRPPANASFARHRGSDADASTRAARNLLQDQFSLQRLAEMALVEAEVDGVEPLLGHNEPPTEFFTIMFALQVCNEVDVYGLEPFRSGANGKAEPVSRAAPYFAADGIDSVFGLEDSKAALNAEDQTINSAILEVFRISNYVKMHY